MFPCILEGTTRSRHMHPHRMHEEVGDAQPLTPRAPLTYPQNSHIQGRCASGHRLRPLSLPMHGARDIRHQELLGASEITGTYVFIPSKTTGPLRGYYPEFLGELAVHS